MQPKSKTSASEKGMLLAAAFPAAILCGLATTAVASPVTTGNDLSSELRTTEITESSSPFETLYCARQPVQVRFIGKLAELVVADESRVLIQAMSASGARYVAPGDDTTEFWSKGVQAHITWSGQELPLCAPTGAIITPYRASGNEPFWSVSYDGWRATLQRPGKPDLVHDAIISGSSATGQTMVAGDSTDGWRLEATDGLCTDSMSGMPHPQHTTLHYRSKTMHGCGGDTERLLQGVSWHITNIGEQASSTAATAYIQFLPDNKITGSTGCNRFFGQYSLTGESLTLQGVGSTRMACSPELMAQENSLLKSLESVSRFSFEDADAQHMVLHADHTAIRAKAKAMQRPR